MTTAQHTLPAHKIESIWEAAERMLDSDPEAKAVCIWEHYNASIGLVPSCMSKSISYVRRAARRKGAQDTAIASYVVTRAIGETYNIETI